MFVYLGGPSGVPGNPSATLDNPTDQAGFFGFCVASAGDVNGDDDLAVGASRQDAPEIDEGGAFVYLGGPSGVSTVPHRDNLHFFSPGGLAAVAPDPCRARERSSQRMTKT